jgi:6-phospho-beta-glucosidase
MKITIIGGGSTYTPELVSGFLERAAILPLSELWLVDIDPRRLEIVGGLAQRMVKARGEPFEVHLSLDRGEALSGAAYVITQLRVGGMSARRNDEYLGKRHHLIGQETTGVGGIAKALRTIPVMLDIAVHMHKLSPKALLLNFTNPAGLVTEALKRHAPQIASVGVCNVAITTKMELLEKLGQLPPERAELDTLGLNHLSWHRGLKLDGEDLWPRLLEAYIAELKADPQPEWDVDMVESLGMIPNYYLQYYYHTEQMLAAQEKWPPSRAEQVMQVEKDLLVQYADPALNETPADCMKRGGAYYSTVATQLISAHFNDLGETHVVNTRQNDAVPGWPADWVLELPCRVSRDGIQPLPARPLIPACFELLSRVKACELLTVEAAVRGDWVAARQALLAHPLGPPADRVQAVLDDLLETHREHLPRFWK